MRLKSSLAYGSEVWLIEGDQYLGKVLVYFNTRLSRVLQRVPHLSLPFRFWAAYLALEQAEFAMFEWLCKPSC